MRMPGTTSSAVIPRRAAHCVHSVTVPSARTASSRSPSGAACSSAMSAVRPGRASHAASPVSHRLTGTPAATPAAATVNAWLQASGRSAPDVVLTTRLREAPPGVLMSAQRRPAGRWSAEPWNRAGVVGSTHGRPGGLLHRSARRGLAGHRVVRLLRGLQALQGPALTVSFTLPEGLAPEVYPLAWLVGRWRGEGVVVYPTIPEATVTQE